MVNVMKGWNVHVYKDDVEVGRAEAVTLSIATNIDPWISLGTRNAEELVEGNEELSGTLTQAWIDTDLLALATKSGGGTEAIPSFVLLFQTTLSGGPYVYAHGCKVDTLDLDLPQDDFLTQDLDFMALYLRYGTTS